MDQGYVEALIRRQVLVQQFSAGQIRKVLPILKEMRRQVVARIAGADMTEFSMNRLIVLERDISEIVARATEAMQLELDLRDFALQEAAVTTSILQSAVAVDLAQGLNTNLLAAIVTETPFQLVSGQSVQVTTIPQMFEDFDNAASRDILRVVRDAILEGKTQVEAAREVAELTQTRTVRQAGAVVRTATNAVGSEARRQVYRSNSDILDGERFLATLDNRTTLTCAKHDQEVFTLGTAPQPPLHYNCRSIVVPVIREQYLVTRQGQRASMQGPVSNQMTYGGWLSRQPAKFQDRVLGPARAKMFRSGEIKIDQFTDDMGRVLTLEELGQSSSLLQ